MTVAVGFDLELALERARVAARSLPSADRRRALLAVADALESSSRRIVTANRADVELERRRGVPEPKLDRLTLSDERLSAAAAAVRVIADLPDPLGRVIDGWRLENGLEVRKVTVPFGVIGMIYESRPNVTVDAAALALKGGSAAVLRGSSNALQSNRELVAVIREALAQAGLPADAVQLVDSPDRELVTRLLEARGKVDLVIPRGGASLISHVVENAKVPVIETGVGNCHVYVDSAADPEMARRIVVNAKVQRPGVCNAAESLLVHEGAASDLLPGLLRELQGAGVAVVGCDRTVELARRHGLVVGPASEGDWAEEFLDLKLAVRLVRDVEEAVEHIGRYGTGHSEAIVTRDRDAARRFQEQVDAAVVLVNASTRFTDGFEFGFGAEIGISTQKLHARGPMGLAEIVTHKYLIEGDGQIRE